jgi:cysteine synthase A
MDQFTYAERATDWRGNNNIAENMFSQMARNATLCQAGLWWPQAPAAPARRWPLCALSATPPSFAWPTPLVRCFGEYHRTGDASITGLGSHVKAFGRPRVEASFIRGVIDRMIEVVDVNSLAAMKVLSALLGRKVRPQPVPTLSAC